MARVPDEAIRRRKELTAGAWHLYELYCLHRNTASGLCNPSNTTLAAEMRCSYTHVSDCKTELVEEGWIARDGRQRVKLLVGEFPPLKVRQFDRPAGARTSENSELQLRKIPKLAPPNFGEFRTSTSENSELQPAPPTTLYKDITSCNEPVAAAASEVKDFKKEPVDEAFVDRLIESRLYPPGMVRFVTDKLIFHCAEEGSGVPNKGRLLHWLSIEREAVPMSLFERDSMVVESISSASSVTNKLLEPNLLAPNPECETCQGAGLGDRPCHCQICPHCNGTGTEVSEAPYVEPEDSGSLVWNQVMNSIMQKLQGESFETWFVPIRLVAIDEMRRSVHLWAPNQVVRDWVMVNYTNLLDQALSEAGSAGFELMWSLPNARPCRHKTSEQKAKAEAG